MRREPKSGMFSARSNRLGTQTKEVAKGAEKIRFQVELKARELPRIEEWLHGRGT
jgi:hypothetical protein